MNLPAMRSTLLLAVCAFGLNACDSGGARTPRVAPASEETFENFGDYELHFNALRTDQLTPEVARTYNIQRSTNRVMLNVTLLHKQADGQPRMPVEAEVSVDAYNLAGQLKNLTMRRVSEGTAIYYIGEVNIASNEMLVFDIKATPAGQAQAFTVKFKREFFAG
jgi:hypothetical protein